MKLPILPILFFCMAMAVAIGLVSILPAPSGISNPNQPQVIMEVLDGSLDRFRVPWQAEIERRFPHSVAILVHGGDFEQGRWIVEGNYASGMHVQTAEAVVDKYRAMFPDRTLILLACNPGHIAIHNRPGVFYFPSSVWCIPDRAITADLMAAEKTMTLDSLHNPFEIFDPPAPVKTRWEIEPDFNGNIFEAVEAN